MSNPEEHSRSGFEPGGGAGDPGGGELGGAGAEAKRFWDEYARRPRPGAQREQRASAEAGNGQGSAGAHPHECLDWCPICRAADVLRASASPELRDQIGSVQRDALVALRALLDAYIERNQASPRRRSTAVEDIPID